MAGLKKKKKEKSGSPNIVLVIFLVFFVIGNIVLGIFFYSSIEEKEAARKAKVDADNVRKADQAMIDYYQMLWRESRKAIGDAMDEKEIERLKLDREAFKKGIYDKQKDKEFAVKFMKTLEDSLGEAADGFNNDYPKLLAAEREKVKKIEGTIAAQAVEIEKAKLVKAELARNYDKIYDAAIERIKDGNDKSLKASQTRSAEFLALDANLKSLKTELDMKKDEINKLVEEQDAALRVRDKELAALRARVNENAELAGRPGAGAGNQMVRADAAPLILDINKGRPLWDQPVGRVSRVDLETRQVVVELFHNGAKPELTFNLFGAGAASRGEGPMKGSIEIIKILEPKSAVARITSLYDSEGMEIPLGLQTRGRILRETDAPLREGDLLYNLFWGSHVAIAGLVNLDETASSNPADQNRAVLNMVSLLERQGMTVDAYVDLSDGQIKGKLTNKTRYLIIGDPIQVKSLLASLDGDWKGQNIELNFTDITFRGEIRIPGADDKVAVNRLNGVVQEAGGRRFLPWANNEALEIVLEDNGKLILENKNIMVRLELTRQGGGQPAIKKEMKEPKEEPAEKKEGDEEKKMEKMEKKEGGDPDNTRGRSALIAAGMNRLREEAQAKGVVQISSENFLNVIGYRKARNANTEQRSNFRPFLPYAGAWDQGQMRAAPEPMPMPPAPDMDKDKKDDK